MKIYKLILIGHLILSFPIIGILILYYTLPNFSTDFLLLSIICFYIFWCGVIPYYKTFVIKRLSNKLEYYQWKSISIKTGLFWPDNFILTTLEFWNEKRFREYKVIRNELLEN